MASVFGYQSSEVDWCEDNYKMTEKIAEFYNTVSSVSFFIFSPLMMYLLHPYAQERTQAVHLVWILIMVVGIFSAYYHMTLSYLGQLLDEIAILWVLAVGYALWFPQIHFPAFIKSRSHFVWLIFIGSTFSTLLSFAKPVINAYALNSVTLHILYVLSLEIRKCNNRKIHRLAYVTVSWWAVAISCWISDRLFCGFWKKINFCYLHSFWHILISVSVAHATALFAYIDAQYEIPQCKPEVRYWPNNSWKLSLPYLAIQTREEPHKFC
ncbi:alkaline ceramidase 1 [Protopterus annectens]|uniref:alkaline ceramidase 1 n=1 Tax=Protopterus annectens TaxID=7888 RepID=UPI001CFA5C78|nr:alkaline ceramidase 1 [Protopterus annectens]